MMALAQVESTPNLLTEISWNWNWSVGATLLLAAGAAAWVIAIYAKEPSFVSRRRRAALAAFRLAAIATVIVMLGQPTVQRSRVASPRLVVLLDASASMGTRDVAAADLPDAGGATAMVTRAEAWENLLTTGGSPLLKVLGSRFDLDVVRFAADAEIVTSEAGPIRSDDDDDPANRKATHVGEALDFAIRGIAGPRPAAVIVLTDGINTAGLPLDAAAARARTLGVPIYAVAIGSDRPRPDVAIEDVVVEEVVFPGDRLQLEATIRSVGYAGREARIVLKRAGSDEALAETQMQLPEDGESSTVRLALRPTEPGPMPLVVEVAGQLAEDDLANNRSELTLDVRDRPIRTLLVDSTPSFEFRALKSLLERDPAIDLRVWLQDADADFADVDEAALRAFPATEAEWLEYDVVLLGDVDPELLPRQTWEQLQKFVSVHGGGLALIAGEDHMPRAFADIEAMRTLLPVEVSGAIATGSNAAATPGLRIEPTSTGLQDATLQIGESAEASSDIWAELPPLLWIDATLRTKPGVQVLATTASDSGEGEPQPVIMRQYVGAGEVLMHATDETWRWRWRNDDRYFARYWGQVVRRLARGRTLRGVGSLSTNRIEYAPGEPVTIRLRSAAAMENLGEEQAIELIGHTTPTREIQLTRRGGHARIFEATLQELPADRYTARVIGASNGRTPLTSEFTVTAPPAELSQLVVNTSGLKAAAESTGGEFYTTKTAVNLRDDLPEPMPTAVERLPEEPLWNSPWMLSLLCLTLATEWLVRRRSGML